MTTIRLSETTTATPAQFLAALTDFGPGRSEIWGNSEGSFLKVHARTDTTADVTEASSAGGGVWERLTYDWSNPTHIVLTTTDSNTWGRNSGHVYDLRTTADGRTQVDATSVREGITFKGRVLGLLLAVIGKRFVGTSLRASLRAIEARAAQS